MRIEHHHFQTVVGNADAFLAETTDNIERNGCFDPDGTIDRISQPKSRLQINAAVAEAVHIGPGLAALDDARTIARNLFEHDGKRPIHIRIEINRHGDILRIGFIRIRMIQHC